MSPLKDRRRWAPKEGESEVREALRMIVAAEGWNAFCKRVGVDTAQLSRSINGGMPMSTKLAKAAGYRKVIRYERVPA